MSCPYPNKHKGQCTICADFDFCNAIEKKYHSKNLNNRYIFDSRKFKAERIKKRMSCLDIARCIGLDSRTIKAYELGKHIPRVSRIKEIADVLDIDIEKIIKK